VQNTGSSVQWQKCHKQLESEVRRRVGKIATKVGHDLEWARRKLYRPRTEMPSLNHALSPNRHAIPLLVISRHLSLHDRDVAFENSIRIIDYKSTLKTPSSSAAKVFKTLRSLGSRPNEEFQEGVRRPSILSIKCY
jgi:hypothetical protein